MCRELVKFSIRFLCPGEFFRSRLDLSDGWRRWNYWRGQWRALFAAANDEDGDRAGGPCGQIVEGGEKFQHKRGQQQNMKTQKPAGQDHGHDVNNLIRTYPTPRPGKYLQNVGADGNGQSETNARDG